MLQSKMEGKMPTEQNEETVKLNTNWYHGSPDKLIVLKAGSSITPFMEVAKAYSHKPERLELSVVEDTEKIQIHVEVKHDGRRPGFIYQVMIADLEELRKPDENLGPLGEEMVTKREMPLMLIEKTEVRDTYSFDLKEN
jgi:hypothetical protein